ncbi:unnamed protein product [Prorocentrum cordatum]|uniref:Uncharacterized protein n=1 Tax=Prorocentrum cordatum TaxID=2364126 RepID=A0ABN9TGE6_9DINO|nr:unnamed protein product [Polarella glacialis]
MQRAHAIQQSPCGLLAEHSGRRDAEGSGCRSTVGRRRRRRRRRGRTRRRRSAVTPMLIARLCRVEFFQPAGRPRQPGHETDFAPPPAECRQQHLPESLAARASCTAKDQVETREGPPARRESETRERAPTRREERGGGGGGGGGGGEGGPRVDPWIVCPAVQRSERPRGKSCAGPRRVRPASGSISTLGRLTACTSVARARRTSLRSCLRKLPLPHGHIRSGACSQSSTRSRSAGRLLRVADAGSHLGLEVASAPS